MTQNIARKNLPISQDDDGCIGLYILTFTSKIIQNYKNEKIHKTCAQHNLNTDDAQVLILLLVKKEKSGKDEPWTLCPVKVYLKCHRYRKTILTYKNVGNSSPLTFLEGS